MSPTTSLETPPATPFLLDGNAVAQHVYASLRERLDTLSVVPGLAIVLLRDDAPSRKYAAAKMKHCRTMGIACTLHDLSQAASTGEWEERVQALATDSQVHGIFIEHPLPPGVDPIRLYDLIPSEKDVEGIGHGNLGKLMLGRPGLVPPTPAAVMAILDHHAVPLEGRRAVVVGRSDIVGKPVAALLLARHATVVMCHSKTPDLAAETTRADILVVAAGRPGLVHGGHVRKGAVVVDVGTNFVEGRLVGDVDFESVAPRCSAITPVRGGVGPVTTAMLLRNLVDTAERQANP